MEIEFLFPKLALSLIVTSQTERLEWKWDGELKWETTEALQSDHPTDTWFLQCYILNTRRSLLDGSSTSEPLLCLESLSGSLDDEKGEEERTGDASPSLKKGKCIRD